MDFAGSKEGEVIHQLVTKGHCRAQRKEEDNFGIRNVCLNMMS
jgi:hypothetical protein